MRDPIRGAARRVKLALDWLHYWRLLRRSMGDQPPDYANYLSVQLRRTLAKKNTPLQLRTQIMVDAVAQVTDLGTSRILCVGCRNTFELDLFQSNGVAEVVGIDLYSKDPRIQVMDMHQMTFPDGRFDLLYSVHSLEHAYDPQKAAAEFTRVVRPQGLIALEVPVHYETRGADIVDFQNLDTLHGLFAPYIAKVLWCEEVPIGSPTNSSGTPVIRTIFAQK